MTAAERERFEQQVLALIAGEMRRLANSVGTGTNHRASIAHAILSTFPVPTAPPPAAESEDEVVERVAEALWTCGYPTRHGWEGEAESVKADYRKLARTALAAVKGGGGE